MRTTPEEKSARSFMEDPALDGVLQDAARPKALGRNVQGPVNMPVDYVEYSPKSKDDAVQNFDRLANNFINSRGNHAIDLNPNIDEVFAAHELGHIVNRQNNIGEGIRQLSNNKELTNAIAIAGILAGGGYAALNPGNDDYDEAIALSMLSSAPTLIDEASASLTGLDIMKRMGSRASLGQRGKLAGTYLTYLAPALGFGVGGGISAALGNLIDD